MKKKKIRRMKPLKTKKQYVYDGKESEPKTKSPRLSAGT